MENYKAPPIPQAFIWRRAHSFTGLWLVLFLIEHLLANSQAALFLGENGSGFVKAVNGIKNLPYLSVIELFLLGVPFLIHGWWGVRYLLTAKYNSSQTDGSSPSFPDYPRNRAYTWQRVTSWILLFGIAAHVIHMRFLQYPTSVDFHGKTIYINKVESDNGLYPLSLKLGFKIYDKAQALKKESDLSSFSSDQMQDLKNTDALRARKEITSGSETTRKLPWIDDRKSVHISNINRLTIVDPRGFGAVSDPEVISLRALIAKEKKRENYLFAAAIKKWPLKENELLAVSPSFGVAELLLVRDTFKSPLMILLYTGLVLAACFHGFNGLWTFMISWGVTLTARSQALMRYAATTLMAIIAFLGLAAVWGTYWINLYQ